MAQASNADLLPLIRKLGNLAHLSPEERAALLGMPMTVRDLKADHDIVRDRDRPSQCCLLLQGFAFSYKILEGGSRQIFSFHIAGDIPDLQCLHLNVIDHSLATLVPSRVAFITHETILSLIRDHPLLGDLFWRDTLLDAAVFREWMIGLGRREAYVRIAHLFCEMFVRLRTVGSTDGFSCEMPMTQGELGDALGLSTVHVNRVLQELRTNGLISTQRGRLTILDWDGLTQAGEFDPTYLHQGHIGSATLPSVQAFG